MAEETVGAGILNIITESLYDKPIVIFREYVQNSVDSFMKLINLENDTNLEVKIQFQDNDLYILDNGNGIDSSIFKDEMINIASSHKSKIKNIGYKGIGRLSGLSYCSQLQFINICDYKNNYFQIYTINCNEYNKIKNDETYNQMKFSQLMDKIGRYEEDIEYDDNKKEIESFLSEHSNMFISRNKGFLVILKNVSKVLNNTIEDKNFLEDLGWLLPVRFKEELFKIEDKGELFKEISNLESSMDIPAPAFNISFNNKLIERPLETNMLRKYLCKCDLKYGIAIHTFMNNKIEIIKGNPFSGIKIYIDNMLLCDENELLPMLQKYGYLDHSINELVQTVKGIGALIYITDKVFISANARRTFIEVTDNNSLEFLELLSEFIKNIYTARYALSKLQSGKKNAEIEEKQLEKLKDNALVALQKLAQSEITIDEPKEEDFDFNKLSESEQKKLIKKKISKELNNKIHSYLTQASSFDYENAYKDFKIWLSSN